MAADKPAPKEPAEEVPSAGNGEDQESSDDGSPDGEEEEQESDDISDEDTSEVRLKSFQDSTLYNALVQAAVNNKEILMTQSDLKHVHENWVLASAAFRPTVGAKAEFSHVDDDDWPAYNGTETKSYHNKSGCRLTVSQNLFNGLSDTATLKSTDKQIRAMWSKFEATKQKVFREVAEYYFEIYSKMREIRHIQALLKSRLSSLEVAQEMFKTGAAKYLDVAQASAGCAEIKAKLEKAKAEYSSLRAKFKELTGFELPRKLDAPEKLFDDKMSLQQGIDLAIKYNPDIIAASDSLSSAKEAVGKPLSKLLPSFGAEYSLGRSGTKYGSNVSRNSMEHTFTVSATIPIYDGGIGRSERRQAIEAATKAAVEKEKVIEETKTKINSTWANLRAARSNLASAKEAVKARELALRVTEEEHKAGLKITNDVLKAQQELFEAKFLVITAEKEYFVSQCAANALLGRLNAKYLKLNTPEFDYRKHYADTKGKL
jgi:TolC family type I secretion outer membrane protein